MTGQWVLACQFNMVLRSKVTGPSTVTMTRVVSAHASALFCHWLDQIESSVTSGA